MTVYGPSSAASLLHSDYHDRALGWEQCPMGTCRAARAVQGEDDGSIRVATIIAILDAMAVASNEGLLSEENEQVLSLHLGVLGDA
jgi:hypothetical protein